MFGRGAREFYKPERMLAFSDGVVAVAITLLVLDLKVPPLAKGKSEADILRDLVEMLPSLSMYFTSFIVIGILWFGHHRKFSYIRRVDRRILWLNLFFLMSVGLVPFVTALLSQNGTRIALILYSGTLAVTSLFSAAISLHAVRGPDLIDAAVPHGIRRDLILSPLLTAAVFALSVALAFVSQTWARYVLLLLVPASMYAGARVPKASAPATGA